MKAPQELALAKHDNSAQRLLLNMKAFSELLAVINNNFPVIIKDASKWDVLGKAARKYSKLGSGRANIDLLKSHYLQLQSFFAALSSDVSIYSQLPQAEDSDDTRLEKMAQLSGNQEVFSALLKVFSSTTLLGLGRHSIRSLIDSLERQRHIATSPEFRKALDELDGFLDLFFSANDGQNSAAVDEIQNAELINLAEQFEPMARLCHCIVNFVALSDSQSQEKSKQQISKIKAASDSADAIFLFGDFIQLFGLETLGELLADLKAWQEGKQDSLNALQLRLATLFNQRAEQLLSTDPTRVYPVANETWFLFQSTYLAFLSGILTEIQDYMSGKKGPFSYLQTTLKTNQILIEKELRTVHQAYLTAERNRAGSSQDASPEELDLEAPVGNDNNRVEVIADDSALQLVPEHVVNDGPEDSEAVLNADLVPRAQDGVEDYSALQSVLAGVMDDESEDPEALLADAVVPEDQDAQDFVAEPSRGQIPVLALHGIFSLKDYTAFRSTFVLGHKLEDSEAVLEDKLVTEAQDPPAVVTQVLTAQVLAADKVVDDDALDFSPVAIASSTDVEGPVEECTFEVGEVVEGTDNALPTAVLPGELVGQNAPVEAERRSPPIAKPLRSKIAFFEQEQARVLNPAPKVHKPLLDLPPVGSTGSVDLGSPK